MSEKQPPPAKARPMPARALTDLESEGDADTGPEREIVVEGESWRVWALGSSGGAAPLLLLGFRRSDSEEDAPQREALVPGRTLGALGDGLLEEAFAASAEPRPIEAPKPLFDEGKGRRRRR